MNYILKSIIPIIILFVVTYGFFKGVKVYECFVEGAKKGLTTTLRIFPYLLAMLIAVNVFTTSKAMDYFIFLITPLVKIIGLPPEVVPLVLIKPLSGSGAIGVFVDTLKNFGADSYIGMLSSVVMGTTETLFYVLTVYFGSVGIKKTRHAVWTAVLADIISIIMAITLVRLYLN